MRRQQGRRPGWPAFNAESRLRFDRAGALVFLLAGSAFLALSADGSANVNPGPPKVFDWLQLEYLAGESTELLDEARVEPPPVLNLYVSGYQFKLSTSLPPGFFFDCPEAPRLGESP